MGLLTIRARCKRRCRSNPSRRQPCVELFNGIVQPGRLSDNGIALAVPKPVIYGAGQVGIVGQSLETHFREFDLRVRQSCCPQGGFRCAGKILAFKFDVAALGVMLAGEILPHARAVALGAGDAPGNGLCSRIRERLNLESLLRCSHWLTLYPIA